MKFYNVGLISGLVLLLSGCCVGFLDLDDLDELFDDKDCVEANLISLSTGVISNDLMIDKETSASLVALKLSVNVSDTEADVIRKQNEKNATSKINELSQYNEITSSYELVSEEGPPHSKLFKVKLLLGDETYSGSGTSLKKAKADAAISALENTQYEHPPLKIRSEEDKPILTPTVVLNNVATKLGIAVSYTLITDKNEKDVTFYDPDRSVSAKKNRSPNFNDTGKVLRVPTEDTQISGPFTVRAKVGDSVYLGVAHTIQGARHDAAIKAIKSMEKEILQKNNICAVDESADLCKEKKESLKSPISRVYETAQKHKIDVEFNIIGESGKSHNKNFVTECKLGSFVTQGEGRSKKDSKRAAAEQMVENLSKLPEMIDGKIILNDFNNKKKKKKKKNKIDKSNVLTITKEVGNMLDSFWSTEDKKNDDTPSPKQAKSRSDSTLKDKILKIGNLLNFEVQFSDVGKKGDKFYTLMSLGLKPSQFCLGKASSIEKSHHKASKYGLRFLKKSGLLEDLTYPELKDESLLLELEDQKIDVTHIVLEDESEKKIL